MKTLTKAIARIALTTCLAAPAMAQSVPGPGCGDNCFGGGGTNPTLPGAGGGGSCTLTGHVNVTGIPEYKAGLGWVAEGSFSATTCTLNVGFDIDCTGTLTGIGTVIARVPVGPGQYTIALDYAASGSSEASQAVWNRGYTQYAGLAKSVCTGATSDGAKYQNGDVYTYP